MTCTDGSAWVASATVTVIVVRTRPDAVVATTAQGSGGSAAAGTSAGPPGVEVATGDPLTVSVTVRVVPLLTEMPMAGVALGEGGGEAAAAQPPSARGAINVPSASPRTVRPLPHSAASIMDVRAAPASPVWSPTGGHGPRDRL